jgi:hypothetical protein
MKIQKAVSIKKVNNKNNTKDDLNFWLTKSSEERVSAVEFLRRQSMEVQTDFKELLELFNAHKVQYLIVGDIHLHITECQDTQVI